jgi:hypothetical protein
MSKNRGVNGSEPARIRRAMTKGTPKSSREKDRTQEEEGGAMLLCMGQLVVPN